jgi:hypothetical protein
MFSSTRSATDTGFAYTPPASVYGAVRVLVIAKTIKPEIMANVLRGFWRFTPLTRLLIVENEALAPTMMNDNMRPVDLSTLPMRPYLNRYVDPPKQIIAPSLLAEVDACITLNTLTPDNLSELPSLTVMREQAQNNTELMDTYLAIGHLFAGGVVDCGSKIIWGDNLLDVDEAAHLAVGEPRPEMITTLRKLKQG